MRQSNYNDLTWRSAMYARALAELGKRGDLPSDLPIWIKSAISNASEFTARREETLAGAVENFKRNNSYPKETV